MCRPDGRSVGACGPGCTLAMKGNPKISEGLAGAGLEEGDWDNESARLPTPFLPNASSQRVRAAGSSGVVGTRRKDAVFSGVESWCFVWTIHAGHCKQNPAKANLLP